MSPFQAFYGFMPQYGNFDLDNTKLPLTERLEKMTLTAKRKRETIEEQYNKRRKPALKYKIGDQVLLDTEGMRQNDASRNTSKKLANRWQGPYSIKDILPQDVYRLNLSPATRMHNAVHTSKLKPYIY